MSEDLPNLGKLIKLLKMTTSSNDSEAIAFMRRANLELEKFGGDWESLLRGKVTVIGDPFDGVEAPKHHTTVTKEPYRTAPPTAPTRQAPRQPHPSSVQAASSWQQADAAAMAQKSAIAKAQADAKARLDAKTKTDADAARTRTQPRTNLYAAKCRVCGTSVPVGAGFLIGTTNGWRVECFGCHKGQTSQAQAAPHGGRKRGAFSLDTLANIMDDKGASP